MSGWTTQSQSIFELIIRLLLGGTEFVIASSIAFLYLCFTAARPSQVSKLSDIILAIAESLSISASVFILLSLVLDRVTFFAGIGFILPLLSDLLRRTSSFRLCYFRCCFCCIRSGLVHCWLLPRCAWLSLHWPFLNLACVRDSRELPHCGADPAAQGHAGTGPF